MLLICNHQTKLAEKNAFLNQSVGSNHNINHAHLQRSEYVFALSLLQTTCQQAYFNTIRSKKFLQRTSMLLCQYFRWHHQGPLTSPLNNTIKCNSRNNCLPGSYISLQQSIH